MRRIKTQFAFAPYVQRDEIRRIKEEISNSPFKYKYFVTLSFSDYCLPKSPEQARKKYSGFKHWLARQSKTELVIYSVYADEYSAIARRPHFHSVILSKKPLTKNQFSRWKYGLAKAEEYIPELDGVGYMYENHEKEEVEIVCGVAKHRKRVNDCREQRKVLCCPFREHPHLAGVGSIKIGSCGS